jgi:hypothetical protein
MNHREQVEQAVLHILNETDTVQATKLLDTTLGYMLEVFKAPEINNDTMDLAVYLLQDKVQHFATDNFQDLPDELYPLAILRTVAIKLAYKNVIDPDNMKYFGDFNKRYQKYIVGKYTRDVKVDLNNDEFINARTLYKDKLDSAKTALDNGLTARQWLNSWQQDLTLRTKS